MKEFPRTMVGGISLPRLLIGTNWFLGYSHTSLAKDILMLRSISILKTLCANVNTSNA